MGRGGYIVPRARSSPRSPPKEAAGGGSQALQSDGMLSFAQAHRLQKQNEELAAGRTRVVMERNAMNKRLQKEIEAALALKAANCALQTRLGKIEQRVDVLEDTAAQQAEAQLLADREMLAGREIERALAAAADAEAADAVLAEEAAQQAADERGRQKAFLDLADAAKAEEAAEAADAAAAPAPDGASSSEPDDDKDGDDAGSGSDYEGTSEHSAVVAPDLQPDCPPVAWEERSPAKGGTRLVEQWFNDQCGAGTPPGIGSLPRIDTPPGILKMSGFPTDQHPDDQDGGDDDAEEPEPAVTFQQEGLEALGLVDEKGQRQLAAAAASEEARKKKREEKRSAKEAKEAAATDQGAQAESEPELEYSNLAPKPGRVVPAQGIASSRPRRKAALTASTNLSEPKLNGKMTQGMRQRKQLKGAKAAGAYEDTWSGNAASYMAFNKPSPAKPAKPAAD